MIGPVEPFPHPWKRHPGPLVPRRVGERPEGKVAPRSRVDPGDLSRFDGLVSGMMQAARRVQPAIRRERLHKSIAGTSRQPQVRATGIECSA